MYTFILIWAPVPPPGSGVFSNWKNKKNIIFIVARPRGLNSFLLAIAFNILNYDPPTGGQLLLSGSIDSWGVKRPN